MYPLTSIIVPAYNEEKSIRSTLLQILKTMEESKIPFELIAVDDGSEDGTSEEIKVKGVNTIRHSINKGYGAAIKTGIRFAKGNLVVITDADGTYPNDRIPELVKIYVNKKCDMVVGARVGSNVKIPTTRRPAKWVLNKLANYLTGVKIPDLNSGLRVMNKKILLDHIKLFPNGFSFTTTLTLIMLTSGYFVEYVPINYNKRKGKSKIKPVPDTLNFIQLLIQAIMYFNPLKIFFPLSLFFFVLGIAFLIRDIIAFNIAQTSVLFIISGGIIISIGLLADLIIKKL